MFVHTFYTSADLPGFFQDTFEPGKALKSQTYVIIVDLLMNLFITKVAYNELLMTLKYVLSLPDFFFVHSPDTNNQNKNSRNQNMSIKIRKPRER